VRKALGFELEAFTGAKSKRVKDRGFSGDSHSTGRQLKVQALKKHTPQKGFVSVFLLSGTSSKGGKADLA
jgi:hypothetical protein